MITSNKIANLHKLKKIIKEELLKLLDTPEGGQPKDGKVDNITELGTQLIKIGNLVRAGKIPNLDKTEIEQISNMITYLLEKSTDSSSGATLQRIVKYSKAQFPAGKTPKSDTK